MGKETTEKVADGKKAKHQQEDNQDHPQIGFCDALFDHQDKMHGSQEVNYIDQTVEAFPCLAKTFLPWWEGCNCKWNQQ